MSYNHHQQRGRNYNKHHPNVNPLSTPKKQHKIKKRITKNKIETITHIDNIKQTTDRWSVYVLEIVRLATLRCRHVFITGCR
ncbi:MAG: hypothetical protein LBQ66_09875 [Planctomycetaceae bacterium]|nr:hypothetical protein [Planctomycetaceae bacterium]